MQKYANYQCRHNHHHHQHSLIQWPKSIPLQGTLDENSQRWTMECPFDIIIIAKNICILVTEPNPTQPISTMKISDQTQPTDEPNPRPCLILRTHAQYWEGFGVFACLEMTGKPLFCFNAYLFCYFVLLHNSFELNDRSVHSPLHSFSTFFQ